MIAASLREMARMAGAARLGRAVIARWRVSRRALTACAPSDRSNPASRTPCWRRPATAMPTTVACSPRPRAPSPGTAGTPHAIRGSAPLLGRIASGGCVRGDSAVRQRDAHQDAGGARSRAWTAAESGQSRGKTSGMECHQEPGEARCPKRVLRRI